MGLYVSCFLLPEIDGLSETLCETNLRLPPEMVLCLGCERVQVEDLSRPDLPGIPVDLPIPFHEVSDLLLKFSDRKSVARTGIEYMSIRRGAMILEDP